VLHDLAALRAALQAGNDVRTRKLIGTVVLLVLLAGYALAVVGISAGRITTAAPLVQLAFFVVAGLAWVVPAALLIRWMHRH
jgi:uncharacterized membrane protein YkgB